MVLVVAVMEVLMVAEASHSHSITHIPACRLQCRGMAAIMARITGAPRQHHLHMLEGPHVVCMERGISTAMPVEKIASLWPAMLAHSMRWVELLRRSKFRGSSLREVLA
jgi:hypothetical protein